MIANAAIVLLALYLLLGEPLLGRISHRRMLTALATGRDRARLGFFLRWTWQGWALMLVTLGITLGLAGWSPASMGFTMPHWTHPPDLSSGTLAGFIAAAIGGFTIAVLQARRNRSRAPARQRPGLANNPGLLAMFPRSPAERRAWALLSVTAGITEEVIWRGFGLTLLFSLLPAAHPALPITLAAAAFGWAHFYQGAIGMLSTAILGALFAWLFWASGSLLPSIVLHALIDMRILLMRIPSDIPTIGAQA